MNREAIKKDLRRILCGGLPVSCGKSPDESKTGSLIEVKADVIYTQYGEIEEYEKSVIVCASDFTPAPRKGDEFYVNAKKYRVLGTRRTDFISLIIDLRAA